MSKSERVDEIAPIVAGVARLGAGALRAAGSVAKSFAKEKAMEKAKEKVGLSDLEKTRAREAHFKQKNAGRERSGSATRQAAQDSATRRSELGEALHTAYKNFIMEAMTGPGGKGLSPAAIAKAAMKAASKNADSREERIAKKKAAIAAKQKQQGPSLLSRASERVKKFMANRKEAAEQKAIIKGKAERRDAEQKKYLAGKNAEEKAEIARKKRVAAFGKGRKKVEKRRLKKVSTVM